MLYAWAQAYGKLPSDYYGEPLPLAAARRIDLEALKAGREKEAEEYEKIKAEAEGGGGRKRPHFRL